MLIPHVLPADEDVDENGKPVVSTPSDAFSPERALNGSVASDIISPLSANGGDDVISLGKIDRQIARSITPGINTSTIVLTAERIAHMNERHPGDYDRFGQYIYTTVSAPSFVMRDPKHENTGIYIKKLFHDGERINLRTTVRYHTPNDPEDFANSVISYQYIRDQEYRRLRKKTDLIVYTADDS